jgi:hypothetical protein
MNVSAQNIGNYYVKIPDALNPTLSKQNRHELLEYHKAKLGDSIVNVFGNKAYLQKYDTINQRIIVKNTASSTFDMALLQLDANQQVIGLIRTVCGPICQSIIEFYDTAWQPISLQFTMPKSIQWMNEDAFSKTSIDRIRVQNIMQNSFVSLSFSADKQEIIAKNNSLEFLNNEDKKMLTSLFIDKPLVLKLEKSRWTLKPL